jgi:hypothetical protein
MERKGFSNIQWPKLHVLISALLTVSCQSIKATLSNWLHGNLLKTCCVYDREQRTQKWASYGSICLRLGKFTYKERFLK